MPIISPNYEVIFPDLTLLFDVSCASRKDAAERVLAEFEYHDLDNTEPLDFSSSLYQIMCILAYMVIMQDFPQTALDALLGYLKAVPIRVKLSSSNWKEDCTKAHMAVSRMLTLAPPRQLSDTDNQMHSSLVGLVEQTQYLRQDSSGCGDIIYYINGQQTQRINTD